MVSFLLKQQSDTVDFTFCVGRAAGIHFDIPGQNFPIGLQVIDVDAHCIGDDTGRVGEFFEIGTEDLDFIVDKAGNCCDALQTVYADKVVVMTRRYFMVPAGVVEI